MLIPNNVEYLTHLKSRILLKCKKCQRRGVIDGIRCECLKEFDSLVRLNYSGIDKEFWRIDGRTLFASCKKANTFFKCFVLKRRPINLFMFPPSIGSSSYGSNVGIGILLEALRKEKTAFYFRINDYLKEISKKFNDERNDEIEDVLERIFTCNILMIDNGGAECYNQQFSSSELEELYRRRKGKLLYTIMNFSIDVRSAEKRYSFLSDAFNSENSYVLQLDKNRKGK